MGVAGATAGMRKELPCLDGVGNGSKRPKPTYFYSKANWATLAGRPHRDVTLAVAGANRPALVIPFVGFHFLQNLAQVVGFRRL